MSEMEELRCVAIVEKETARTKRYQELVPSDTDPILYYLYLQKKGLAKIGNPKMVEIIIRAK